jgi:hypothetical protein
MSFCYNNKENKMTVKKEDWIPYTYLITHIPSNQKYYGVRYAKGCNPSEFWNLYFTSSKYVAKLISETGKDSFVFEIRRTFSDVSAARKWEHKFLRRIKAPVRSDFLNKTDNISISPQYGTNNPASREEVKEKIRYSVKKWLESNPNPMLGKSMPLEVRKKLSEERLGQNNPFFGKTHTEETKQLLSANAKGENNNFFGKTHTEETKQAMSVMRAGVKKPKIECPRCKKLGAPYVMARWHFDNCKGEV